MKLNFKTYLTLGLIVAALAYTIMQVAHDRHAAALARATPAERGWMLIEENGCLSCHQKDSSFRAPVLAGLLGRKVRLADGKEFIADEAYIRESLSAPMSKIVAGYQGVMPSFKGSFTDEELAAIIEALKPKP